MLITLLYDLGQYAEQDSRVLSCAGIPHELDEGTGESAGWHLVTLEQDDFNEMVGEIAPTVITDAMR